MKIAVCDDEKQFIEEVCPLLETRAKQHDIQLSLFCFTNGDDLIDAHKSKCMDLIFLDIIMPLLNGIETAKELRRIDTSVPIIFLTSAKEFAVDSYDVKAFWYLLKPLDNKKLQNVLEDFIKAFPLTEQFITVQTSDGFCKIFITNVCYLEAQNKHVLVYLTDGRAIQIKERFLKCHEIFSADKGFFLCHRSYIVNLNYVEQFSKTSLITSGHVTIPISRNRYTAFKEAYFSYMFR